MPGLAASLAFVRGDFCFFNNFKQSPPAEVASHKVILNPAAPVAVGIGFPAEVFEQFGRLWIDKPIPELKGRGLEDLVLHLAGVMHRSSHW